MTTSHADEPTRDDQTDDQTPDEQERRSREKDPSDWVTGDEPATGAQLSYLGTLAREAGEPEPDSPTKAEASIAIDELQDRTGRG